MKTGNSLFGGKLRDDYKDTYVDYLINYLKSFKENGVDIFAITAQNEPQHEDLSYPTMKMEWYEELNFLRVLVP